MKCGRKPGPDRVVPEARSGAIVTLAAIAAIALLVAWLQPGSPLLSGRAQAIDGDTLRLGSTRIRLPGIDAVELDQICSNDKGEPWGVRHCGGAPSLPASSMAALRNANRQGATAMAGCWPNAKPATAISAGAVVKAGWAVADVEYGLALVQARTGRHGIWSGTFDDPAEWRRSHGADTFDLWAWLDGLVRPLVTMHLT